MPTAQCSVTKFYQDIKMKYLNIQYTGDTILKNLNRLYIALQCRGVFMKAPQN